MFRVVFLFSIVLVPFSCQNVPTYPTGQDDLIEMESVWQYLKAYSIHQDECTSGSGSSCVKKLRDSPFFYKSPEEMMLGLDDTLGAHNYTTYCDYELTSDNSTNNTAFAYHSMNAPSERYVYFYQITESTALIRLYDQFITGTTYKQFLELLPNLKPTNKNLIIDVCGNRGGDLDELDSILELFLPENKPYILARERAYDSTSRQYITIDFRPLKTKRPASPYLEGKKVVVLMDHGSASAAEILASGLKDGCGAVLVGDTTYGKAIGQIKLSRRGRKSLQITFLQLKGISAGVYQNVGLQPDITTSNLNIYQSRGHLLEIVRLLEPDVQSSNLSMPSSLRKAKVSVIPEGYIIRDVQIGP